MPVPKSSGPFQRLRQRWQAARDWVQSLPARSYETLRVWREWKREPQPLPPLVEPPPVSIERPPGMKSPRPQPTRRLRYYLARTVDRLSIRIAPSARSTGPGVSVWAFLCAILGALAAPFVRLWVYSRRNVWAVAAATGTVGVILTFVLQIAGAVSAARTAAPNPPAALADNAIRPSDPSDLPARPPETGDSETSDEFWDKPADVEPIEMPDELIEPEMDIQFSRTAIPADARELFEPPDSQEAFLVTSREDESFVPDSGDPFAAIAARVEAEAAQDPEANGDEGTNEAYAWSPADDRLDRPEPGAGLHEQCGGETVAELEMQESPEITMTQPGAKHLNVTVEKVLPDESGQNEVFEYQILVHNHGEQPVDQVLVREKIPVDHHVSDVAPPAMINQQHLSWTIERLEAGTTKTLTVQLLAGGAGTVETETEVSATTAIAADTIVEKPRLELRLRLPKRVTVGAACPIDFEIENVGEVAAGDVVLRTDLPQELSYDKGRELDYKVGTLAPGEKRVARLTAKAEEVGSARQIASIEAAGFVVQQTSRDVQIDAPVRQPAAIPRARIVPPPRVHCPPCGSCRFYPR